jgi:hypothetical protein
MLVCSNIKNQGYLSLYFSLLTEALSSQVPLTDLACQRW